MKGTRSMGLLQALVVVAALIATALPVQSGPLAAVDYGYSYNSPPYYSPPPPTYYSPPPPPTYYSPPPPEYYSPPPPPDYYSPPPPPEYYSPPPPPTYYSPPPPPEYYSPPPPPTYYSPPPPEYYSPPPPPYYSPPPPPEYYSPPPPPTYYSPPPPPTYYSPPPPEYYSPPPPPTYYSPPPPPVYYAPPPPPYYTKPEYYSKEYYPEYVNYDAVHYLELNDSVKCGVLPAVNADLYKGAYNPQEYEKSYSQYGSALLTKDDVEPFGANPWRVLITDDYNNLICQGVIVQNRQILTLASCIEYQPLDKLRVRYGDWDVLNDVNEYEAYKNYQTRICRVLPVTCPSYGYNSNYQSELVLLQVEIIEDYDKYPQIKPVCLPEYPYTPPPPPPSYTPPPYSSSYSPPPPAYSPPPYYQPVYSECWVAGYYASPSKELQNHEPPKGSSYAPKDYNPYYSNEYYPEKSKIPRKALVKQVQSYYQSASYKDCQDEIQEWVGVEGWDACVADKGAAIVCIVDEKVGYGYSSYETPTYYEQTYQNPPSYAPYENYQEIKVNAAQEKNARKRVVVVAVVKEVPKCTEYEVQAESYGYAAAPSPYEKQQSGIIKAVKVSTEDVNFIVDIFFEGALDYSCPTPKSYYPEPSYYPETKSYSPPPAYYEPPTYTPYYSPPPPAYYSPPPPEYYSPPPPPAYYSPPPPPEYYSPPPPPAYYSPPPPEYYSPPPPPYYSPPPPTYYSPPPPEYYSPPPPPYTPPYSPPPTYTPSYSPPPYSPPPPSYTPSYSPPPYSPPPPSYSPPPYSPPYTPSY
ncbi:unnamed protein product [Allacma fusca]|uniref:Peptidase S1 domain-containing protein n=1 Tax=Allacma fusca TaxID=39272 RepID=A0A8J2KE17_9HEXA|nr:unnamed protein product [Allacma fusca]